MAGFFPVFFKQYWNAGVVATESTFRLGVTSGVASLIVALLAPVLGAIADRSSSRVRLLLLCTVLGVAATAGARAGRAGPLAAGGRAVTWSPRSVSGAASSSTIRCCCTWPSPTNTTVVSGFGYALGYLGGGLLFAVNVLMTLQARAGSDSRMRREAVRLSFVMRGVWWFVFALPCVFFVREKRVGAAAPSARARRCGSVSRTAHDARRDPPLPAAAAVPRRILAVHRRREHDHQDGGRLRPVARPRPGSHLIKALLLTQFVAFPGGARLRLARAADRRAQRHLHRARRLHRGHRATPISSSDASRLLPARRRDRAGAGRHPVVEPQLLRAAGARGQVVGVLRLLQHDGQGLGDRRADRSWASTAAVTRDSRLSILSILLLFISGGVDADRSRRAAQRADASLASDHDR